MEYLHQIITPHGAALFILMIISIASMTRIFSCLGDLKLQVDSMEDLIPHLRASISAGNYAKAGVAAESDDSSTGRVMAAILREPTRNAKRMRLIYKLNIDDDLRARLRYLNPLKVWAIWAIILSIAGGAIGWYLPTEGSDPIKRLIIVLVCGIVVSTYSMIFYQMLRRREIEFNDMLSAEALNLIDAATRPRVDIEIGSEEE